MCNVYRSLALEMLKQQAAVKRVFSEHLKVYILIEENYRLLKYDSVGFQRDRRRIALKRILFLSVMTFASATFRDFRVGLH